MPLRMRVRKSAMGSVIDIDRSPTRLRHAGDHPVVRELAQADPAQAELAEDGARPAAAAAARVLPGLVLAGARLADALGELGHLLGVLGSLEVGIAVAAERHAERLEQGIGLGVRLRARGDRDVEAAHLVDRVIVDLREDDLLPDPEVVVATAVEGARRQAAEVADPRDSDRHEAVEELVGALAAQRDRQADRHLLAHLELRDRLARAADIGLLAGDRPQLLGGGVEDLRILLGVAHAHVQRDLRQPRRLHRRRVAEAVDQRGADLLEVALFEAGGRLRCLGCHFDQSSAVPDRRVTRAREPPSRVMPTRVRFLSLGSMSMTLEMWIGPSFSMTPPTVSARCAPRTCCGRWWRFTMLRPST